MIIFNNKGKMTNFIKAGTDTRVFEIHSPITLEELYEYLIRHEDLPEDVEIHQYNYRGNRAQFDSIASAGEDLLTAGTVRRWRSYVEDDDIVSQTEAMKEAKKRAIANNEAFRLEPLFNGYTVIPADTDERHIGFGSFNEVDIVREELIEHVADALCVYPTLNTDTDTSLEEKQKLGRDANRLRWIFSDEDYRVIPPINQVRTFGTFDKYEQSFIADSLNFPGDMLRNACTVKRDHPDFILTPDNVIGTSFRSSAGATLISGARQGFLDRFHNVPLERIGMFEEYVRAQVLAGVTTAEQIVNGFGDNGLRSLRPIAKSGSPVLYALLPHCDFSQFKQEQIYFLATHVRAADIGELISYRFGEWFSRHRNESLADLNELLLNYRPLQIGNWDPDMTARQIIEDIKTRKGREDCANYEQAYHYRFSDNDVAIKGNGLVIKDGAYKMYFLDKADYRNFTVGYDTHCCQHWQGAGGSCVYKLTSDPFAGCVVVERAGKILAQAFVWTDEQTKTFVFDNIEFANDAVVADYANIIATFVQEIPYPNVHMGANYVEGRYTSWGRPLSCGHYNKAMMPTTLDGGTHIYTDYRDNARVFKADDLMLIKRGNAQVERHEDKPSPWAALRDSAAVFLISEWTMPVEERLSFAGGTMQEIEQRLDAEKRKKLFLKRPELADSMDSVPEEWQEALLNTRTAAARMKYIKNPIPELRTKVLAAVPEQAVVWGDLCTKEDWITVLCKKPELTSQCPYELDTEIVTAVYNACGEKALPYIPMSLLDDELLRRVIEHNPRAVLSVDNPSEELLVIAVTGEPLLLSALPLVPEAVGHAAVTAMPASIIFWPDASFAECEQAVIAQPSLIRNLAHRFPSLRETAIRTNPESIWAIPDATDAERNLAVQIEAEMNGGEPVELTPPDEVEDRILGQFGD